MPNQRLNKNDVLKKRLIQSLNIKIDLLLKYQLKACIGEQARSQPFSNLLTSIKSCLISKYFFLSHPRSPSDKKDLTFLTFLKTLSKLILLIKMHVQGKKQSFPL